MGNRWIGITQIALSLVMVCGLATSCEVPLSTSTPNSTPTPSASEYPADISGHVTIADKIVVEYGESHKKLEREPFPRDRNIWWIVDVSVKNNNYENPITSTWDSSIPMPEGVTSNMVWSIIFDGKLWSGLEDLDIFTPPSMRVLKGQSGKTTFVFGMPINISLSDVQLCYRGQKPYSYGKLSGGNKVAVYDWDLKKAVTIPIAKEVGEVKAIHAVYWFIGDCYKLVVEIKPKSSAVANKDYLVELYEKGKLRATGRISWNQPELNVQTVKEIYFPLTREEGEAYAPSPFTAPPLDDIFSAKVLDK